ncbi:MAG: hypothetical protein ACE5I3_14960 [Phycisphaerae bacterium]
MMDEKRVEELLRAYARQRPAERLFSKEVARQLRARLKAHDASDEEEDQPGQPDDELSLDNPQPMS